MINRLLRLMSLEPRGTYYPGCAVFIIYRRYIEAEKYQNLTTFCPLEETLCFSAREAWHGRKLYTLKQFGGPDGLRWLLAERERERERFAAAGPFHKFHININHQMATASIGWNPRRLQHFLSRLNSSFSIEQGRKCHYGPSATCGQFVNGKGDVLPKIILILTNLKFTSPNPSNFASLMINKSDFGLVVSSFQCPLLTNQTLTSQLC